MRTVIYNKGGIPRTMRAPECIAKVIKEIHAIRIAEIGIHACSFSDQLRELLRKESHPLMEYYMIDPWPYDYKCGSCGGESMTHEKWDAYHAAAVRRMIGQSDLKVIRMTSLAAAKLFSDGYFDLVYIDADHTYKSVTEDITAWLPKCKQVICGHDYSGGWQPVVNAVDDFFINRWRQTPIDPADKPPEKEVKKFFQIDDGDKHYRMDSGVWVVEL